MVNGIAMPGFRALASVMGELAVGGAARCAGLSVRFAESVVRDDRASRALQHLLATDNRTQKARNNSVCGRALDEFVGGLKE